MILRPAANGGGFAFSGVTASAESFAVGGDVCETLGEEQGAPGSDMSVFARSADFPPCVVHKLSFRDTAHRPTAGAPVRARQDIQLAHPDAHTVEVLGVQMLETSTLACIVFVVLACVLMCVPESWLGQLRAWGVPDALTDRSVRGGAPTLLIMFVCFFVLSFGGNTLLIAADDQLPTQVYASGVYLMVLFSVIAGYMFLGESATPAKLVGLALVLTGGGLLVYWRDRVDASATRERTDERIARRA